MTVNIQSECAEKFNKQLIIAQQNNTVLTETIKSIKEDYQSKITNLEKQLFTKEENFQKQTKVGFKLIRFWIKD